MLPQYFIDAYVSEEDCALYIPLAHQMFYYLNGKVNTCKLYIGFEVIPYFIDNDALGFTNTAIISIFLGNIIKLYDNTSKDFLKGIDYRRHDYICSVLISTIVHELFHVDQIRYKSSTPFDKGDIELVKIEESVERMTFEFIDSHDHELSNIFGFKYLYTELSYDRPRYENYPFIYEYERFDSLESIYRDTLNPTLFNRYFGKGIDLLKDFNNPNFYLFIHNYLGRGIYPIPLRINGRYIDSISDIITFLQYIRFHDYNGNIYTEYNTTFGDIVHIDIFPINKQMIDPLINDII